MKSDIVDKETSDRPSILFRTARVLGLLLMLACVGVFIISAILYPGYTTRHPDEFTPDQFTLEELDRVLGRVGLSLESYLIVELISAILVAVVFSGAGFFLFFRKSNDWFGLYLGISFVMYGTLSNYMPMIFGSLIPEARSMLGAISVLSWGMFFPLFYLFPDGRFVPRWTRWAALGLVLFFAWDILFYGSASPPSIVLVVLMSLIGVGIVSQVYRYRRVSNILERQQTKWVMFALLLVFTGLVLMAVMSRVPVYSNPDSPAALSYMLSSMVTSFLVALIPLSVGFAVLRYRLWDVDVLIRRTLVYGGLTATLGLVFFGSITLIQALFSAVSGQRSAVSVVVSTLLIAALFSPLRRRIQNDIDRRFYRRKYNAEQAIERFAATARQETNLEALSAELLAVVAETMQPAAVVLWLRQTEDGRPKTAPPKQGGMHDRGGEVAR